MEQVDARPCEPDNEVHLILDNYAAQSQVCIFHRSREKPNPTSFHPR